MPVDRLVLAQVALHRVVVDRAGSAGPAAPQAPAAGSPVPERRRAGREVALVGAPPAVAADLHSAAAGDAPAAVGLAGVVVATSKSSKRRS